MPDYTIGVAVPTLNSASTLEWTLTALQNQRGCNVEIVVADSGSTDGTLDICRRSGVSTIYVEPGNMYRAVNAALSLYKNQWLAYINSDDWVYPDSFARLISRGEESGAGIVYGNCDYSDGLGRFVYSFAAAEPTQLLPLFRMGVLGFAQPAAIFRNNVYQQLGGFSETYSFSSDAEFYFRAILMDDQFARLDGPTVACFRLHKTQLSNVQAEAIQAEKGAIRKALSAGASINDWAIKAHWRLANAPNYAIRLLREAILSGHLKAPRSLDAYTHE